MFSFHYVGSNNPCPSIVFKKPFLFCVLLTLSFYWVPTIFGSYSLFSSSQGFNNPVRTIWALYHPPFSTWGLFVTFLFSFYSCVRWSFLSFPLLTRDTIVHLSPLWLSIFVPFRVSSCYNYFYNTIFWYADTNFTSIRQPLFPVLGFVLICFVTIIVSCRYTYQLVLYLYHN